MPRIPVRRGLPFLAAGLITVAAFAAGNATRADGPVAGATKPSTAKVDKNLYPFGMPQGRPVIPPPPPGEPTLAPAYATKTTTRLWGADPFQKAVSVTQHVWPAERPLNRRGENDNVPDRPWGVTLVTPDDPLTAISATPLIHFPNDAPILYVTRHGVPRVTLNEIKRLGDTGIERHGDVDAFLVGAAANPEVKRQLAAIGVKFTSVTGRDVYSLADNIDKLYGSIENPDTGVPQMGTSASSGGNGMQNVMIGATNAWQYVLPATHWVSHMPTGLLWVDKNRLPDATIDALKRRGMHGTIYVFGGPDQVSPAVVKQLAEYGAVSRVTSDDGVLFNAPPKNTPVNTAVSFAKMYDPMGMVGWGITGPGHGFTLVNRHDWQSAVASAPLSHLGFHAPLLLTDSPSKLPKEVDRYFRSVAPRFLNSPAEGPYNMTFVMGSWTDITWRIQTDIDFVSEMINGRAWNSSDGGRYSDSGQP
ncbi:hypothetical protein [Actinomadura rayongensis]|uniref:Cell wall-binding repeat-containing protein n=1 Tax=Actinomadura rayongensis TaxID=1429076 RepID=A0A6I4W7Y7_9ACTN|nr:hypothetical protein [Actinomadura rayongensis]MXQ65393.1 hypothetical protein [Actinomadura rayongensis]